MKNNKGYIITVNEAIAGDEVLLKLASSKHYIKSLNLPFIIYKDQNQFEEIDTSVRPAFRMNGFLILNFNKDDGELICERVKKLLNNDSFISETLSENEIIEEEEIAYNKIEDLINKVNEILTRNSLKLTKNDVLKISQIKIFKKEENVEIEKLVSNTIKGSLSYLLIKGGELIDSKNISAPSEELKRFVLASRLSSVLLNNFPGIHRDLKEQKVANIALHNKVGGEIILFKQLKDNYNLVFECTDSELDDVKQSIKDLDKKLEKGGSKNE
jgi:predicted DNA-binding protein YlxM (UPF0122 family)